MAPPPAYQTPLPPLAAATHALLREARVGEEPLALSEAPPAKRA